MRASKKMIVVAFDITSSKKRRKVVAQLLKYGKRINKSVFECVVTESQYRSVSGALRMLCEKGDSIVIIPVCLNCYSKIQTIPQNREEKANVMIILD